MTRNIMLAGILAGTVALSACGREPVNPCQVQPTKTNASGEWVEWDDEAMDADPCDSDDLNSDGSHKKPGAKKPAPKNTKPTGKKGFK